MKFIIQQAKLHSVLKNVNESYVEYQIIGISNSIYTLQNTSSGKISALDEETISDQYYFIYDTKHGIYKD